MKRIIRWIAILSSWAQISRSWWSGSIFKKLIIPWKLKSVVSTLVSQNQAHHSFRTTLSFTQEGLGIHLPESSGPNVENSCKKFLGNAHCLIGLQRIRSTDPRQQQRWKVLGTQWIYFICNGACALSHCKRVSKSTALRWLRSTPW